MDGVEIPEDGRGRVATRAVALEAVLREAEAKLAPGERTVLSEWLGRLSRTDSKAPRRSTAPS